MKIRKAQASLSPFYITTILITIVIMSITYGLKNTAKCFVIIFSLAFILLIINKLLEIRKFKKIRMKLKEYILHFDSYIKNGSKSNEIILMDRLTNKVFTYDEFVALKDKADSIDYNYTLKTIKVNYPYESICRLNFHGKRSICVMIIKKDNN